MGYSVLILLKELLLLKTVTFPKKMGSETDTRFKRAPMRAPAAVSAPGLLPAAHFGGFHHEPRGVGDFKITSWLQSPPSKSVMRTTKMSRWKETWC